MSDWRWVEHNGERKLLRLEEFWSDAARAAAAAARRLNAQATSGEVHDAVTSLKRGESAHIDGSGTSVEHRKLGGYVVHSYRHGHHSSGSMSAEHAATMAHQMHTQAMDHQTVRDQNAWETEHAKKFADARAEIKAQADQRKKMADAYNKQRADADAAGARRVRNAAAGPSTSTPGWSNDPAWRRVLKDSKAASAERKTGSDKQAHAAAHKWMKAQGLSPGTISDIHDRANSNRASGDDWPTAYTWAAGSQAAQQLDNRHPEIAAPIRKALGSA